MSAVTIKAPPRMVRTIDRSNSQETEVELAKRHEERVRREHCKSVKREMESLMLDLGPAVDCFPVHFDPVKVGLLADRMARKAAELKKEALKKI